MKRILLGSTVVAVVLVVFFAAWEFMGDHPIRPAALAASPPNTITSPNGLFRIEVTDTGIVLSGPSVLVRVDSALVKVQAPIVNLCGSSGTRVARVGDMVQTTGSPYSQSGPIVQGSPTTFVC